MPARILLVLVSLCFAPQALAQDAPRVAGKIELAEGIARIEAKGQPARRPAAGQSVHEGETLVTAGQSELHLNMADGASLIVRENTRITIAEYVADGGARDRSLIELTRGALRSITGWIGQYNRNSYRVRTPLVTIGVRGTDHEPTHLEAGDPRGAPGSYDKVNEGAAFMETPQGTVDVQMNKAVFQAISAAGLPQLLNDIPSFFKPGRFEQEFQSRAQALKNAIPQRRMDRIEFLKKSLVPKEAQKALDQVKPLEQKGKELLRWLR